MVYLPIIMGMTWDVHDVDIDDDDANYDVDDDAISNVSASD